jgi:DNA (cytosine-5)-methyltransferase 1
MPKYISFCDGIGTAHLAFQPLGWECCGVSEIDPACNAVVDYHWKFPNLGNIFNISTSELKSYEADIFIAGTCCQSFSTVGKRKGFGDARGQITKAYFDLVGKVRPTWVLFENVTGLLSSDGGKVFAAITESLGKFGYGFSWRVLDLSFFGVPQQRRRIYLVAYLGDMLPAIQVLFDIESMLRNLKESRQGAGQDIASDVADGVGAEQHVGVTNVARTLRTRGCSGMRAFSDNIVVVRKHGRKIEQDIATPKSAMCRQFDDKGNFLLRRLTPVECERLQGIPDNYTNVDYKNHPMADFHRYRMIGNSMAVPILDWIGNRLHSTF